MAPHRRGRHRRARRPRRCQPTGPPQSGRTRHPRRGLHLAHLEAPGQRPLPLMRHRAQTERLMATLPRCRCCSCLRPWMLKGVAVTSPLPLPRLPLGLHPLPRPRSWRRPPPPPHRRRRCGLRRPLGACPATCALAWGRPPFRGPRCPPPRRPPTEAVAVVVAAGVAAMVTRRVAARSAAAAQSGWYRP